MSKKSRKLLALCLVVSMILTQLIFTNVAFAAENRLYGSDRYQTAIKISQEWDSSEVAVLAYGENFPDALAAAPLAKKYDAPILLTDKAQLSAGVLAELKRLDVEKVYVVGGEGVVSKAVADALVAEGMEVERLAGASRYETALAVAEEIGTTDTVVVAYGENYPDALSVSAIAAAQGWPILLTGTNAMDAAVKAYIGDKQVYVIGGEGVVSNAAVAGLDFERLSGADRYATNVAVLEAFEDVVDYDNVFLATGENYPDALAGSALAALLGAPVVLVGGSTAGTSYAAGKVTANSAVVAFGGTAVVSSAALNAVTPVVPTELKIESVSAINAKQLKVVFTLPVDKTDAEDEANYLVDGSAVSGTAKLGTDNKTVTITVGNGDEFVNDTTYVLQVNPVKDKDDVKVESEVYVTTQKFSDKVKPVVTKIEAKTNGDEADVVTVYYSEPLESGIIRINGVGYSVAAGVTKQDITLNAGKEVAVGETHSVAAINLTDYASTANVTAYAEYTFSVTKDDVAPTVSVSQYSDNSLLLTFSKEMAAGTVDADFINVVDELSASVELGDIVAEVDDDDDIKFVLPIVDELYATKTSRKLTVSFTEDEGQFEDTLGNGMVEVTKTITLNKDTTGPKVESVTFEKNADDEIVSITIKYDEALNGATVDASRLYITDKDGVLVASGTVLDDAVVADFDKEVVFDLASEEVLDDTWTIVIPRGLVTDISESTNDSAAYTAVLDMTAEEDEDDSFEFEDGSVADMTTSNVIVVTFPEEVKGGTGTGSATNRNNYSINGVVLPEGTKLALNAESEEAAAKTVLTITLPASSIAADDTTAVFRISNVQNADGVTIEPVTEIIDVLDNTKPVLTAAKFLDNVTIDLTFDEEVAFDEEADLADYFVIKRGTTTVTVDGGFTASYVSGNVKKIRLTVVGDTTFDLNKTYTITTEDGSTAVTDASIKANAMKADVAVTISK